MTTTLKITVTYHVPIEQLRYGEKEPKDHVCKEVRERLLDTSSSGWQMRRRLGDYYPPTEVQVEPMNSIAVSDWPFPTK